MPVCISKLACACVCISRFTCACVCDSELIFVCVCDSLNVLVFVSVGLHVVVFCDRWLACMSVSTIFLYNSYTINTTVQYMRRKKPVKNFVIVIYLERKTAEAFRPPTGGHDHGKGFFFLNKLQ